MPMVAKGFAVELVASGIENPRAIRFAPNGDLFVANSAIDEVRVYQVGREEADFGDLRVYVKAWRVMVIDVRCEAAKIAARIRAQRRFSHARSSRMLWPAATRTTLIASSLAPLSQ